MGKIESKYQKGDEIHILSATGFKDPYVAKVTKIKMKKDQFTGKDYNVIMVKGGSFREDTGVALTGSDTYYLGGKVGGQPKVEKAPEEAPIKKVYEEPYKPVNLEMPKRTEPSGIAYAMREGHGGDDYGLSDPIIASIKSELAEERRKESPYSLDQLTEADKQRKLRSLAKQARTGTLNEYFHPDVHKAAQLLSRCEDDFL